MFAKCSTAQGQGEEREREKVRKGEQIPLIP